MTKLYTIHMVRSTGAAFTAEVHIDPSHPVFAGHFPGMPVVPGVFLVEMLAAAVSEHLGKKVVICEADNLKFIQMVKPVTHRVLLLNCSIVGEEPGNFKVDATFSAGNLLVARMKGIGFG